MKKFIIGLILILAACTQPAEHSTGEHTIEHKVMKLHAENDTLNLHNYTLVFQRPVTETGKEALLAFTLTKKDAPLELQTLHEKLMHLILVRNDLKHFDHIHPEQTKQGTYSVPYTFAAAGEYRIWIQFMSGNLEHIIDYNIEVNGTPEAEETDRLGGLHVDMSSPERITEEQPAGLAFSVTDGTGNAVPITEKFLGADAHFIIVSSMLDVFEHLHDASGDKDNKLSFSYTPEQSGNYSAWLEFRVDGTNRIAAFQLPVHKA